MQGRKRGRHQGGGKIQTKRITLIRFFLALLPDMANLKSLKNDGKNCLRPLGNTLQLKESRKWPEREKEERQARGLDGWKAASSSLAVAQMWE